MHTHRPKPALRRDFADLRAIAFLPLTEGDRALLGAVS